MPIRPEDFDASPPRRSASEDSPNHDNGQIKRDDRGKKREGHSWGNWLKEHSSRQAIAVTIAVSAVALTLVASEKPVERMVRSLLSKKKPVVEQVKKPALQEPSTNSHSVQQVPPENVPPATVAPKNDIPVAEPKAQPPNNQTRIKKPGPIPHPARKLPTDEELRRTEEAQELNRQLEEARADAERKQKELSDSQAALEEQRQAAQENLSGPFAPPLGLQDIEMAVKVMSPLRTASSSAGDGISAMVLAPQNYAGAILAGHIVSVKAGKDHDKPEISLQIETLTFHDKRHLIQADLKEVANSRGFNNVDEEGHALGKSSKKKKAPAAGGIFGAAMRGAKTAVVGSGSGDNLLFTIKFTTNAAQIELAPGFMFTLKVSDRKPH